MLACIYTFKSGWEDGVASSIGLHRSDEQGISFVTLDTYGKETRNTQSLICCTLPSHLARINRSSPYSGIARCSVVPND